MTHPDSLRVRVNGQVVDLPAQATLAQAIERAGVRPPFAAAVNLQFVPRSRYASTVLQPDDDIELIAPVTGG